MIDMIHNPNHIEARDQAIDWARNILKRPALIFDTETTGLGHKAGIVSLGTVDLAGNEVLNLLINPEMPIESGATGVHGITNEMVKDCPTFKDAYRQIKIGFGAYPVHIAYNFAFDAPLLSRVSTRYNLPSLVQPQLTGHCAMEAYAAFYGEWSPRYGNYKWQKLIHAANHMGLTWSDAGAHDAAADCHMTAKVIRAMARTLKSTEKQFSGEFSGRALAGWGDWKEAGLVARFPRGEVLYTDIIQTGKTIKLIRLDTGQYEHVYPSKHFVLVFPPTP
jgi:DNA polymerase-3 subunit epsilon